VLPWRELRFGGVRDFDGERTIDPRLPTRFRSLGFSLRFHDRRLRASSSHEVERFSLTEGDPLDVVIRGDPHPHDRCTSRAEPAGDERTREQLQVGGAR
jgi:trehalose/maltose hydrolase-like predicted phosphorylase